jgi:hypothetical protein
LNADCLIAEIANWKAWSLKGYDLAWHEEN